MPPRILLILTENHTMRPEPDVADLVAFAVEAERAGLDGVMVSEHVVLGPSANAAGIPANPRDYALPGNQDPAMPWPSPLVLLSAVAAATRRIRLVAGAMITPLRHPLALAKDLATLDRLSAGRLVVQPTVSWHRDEYDALGITFEHRGDILDEQLAIWTRVWAGSPVSFEGTRYRFADVWVQPQPVTPDGPPLWFGGSSLHRRVIERIVRYGSGFNPLGQPDDAGMVRLEEALISAGRSPAEIEYVGGARGMFAGPGQVADLDDALAAIPALMARGFTTICVKPSQFIDDQAKIAEFCQQLVAKVSRLS
ncbi:MAG: TIGR03619 family F420-dependent LLM class oxidoreductase [Streptosporangiaceae bacterium]